jgi:tetratricopeptide (TPR) repeat protein
LLARAYAASNEEELTRDTYQSYLQVDAENDDIRVEFARKLMQMGRLDDAERQIDLALDHTPNHVAALMTRVDQRIARRSWAAAEAAAQWIIAKTEATGQGHTALGKVLLARGRAPEAVAELRKVASSDASAVEARSVLVQALEASAKADEAQTLLINAIKEEPSDVQARILLADLSFRLGRPSNAEAALKDAIHTVPSLDIAYLKLGDLYVKEHSLEQAADNYREGVKSLPRNAELWLNLGMAEDSLNRYDAARDAYENVLKLQPRNIVASNNLAALIADAWPQDRDLLERARRLSEDFRNRNDGLLLDTLGWIQYRLGNTDDAISLLEHAVSLLPKHPQLRYHLGMAYRAKGDTPKAHSELELAVDSQVEFRGSIDAQRALADF